MKKLTIDDFPGFVYKEDFSYGRILATPNGIIFTDVDEFDKDPLPDDLGYNPIEEFNMVTAARRRSEENPDHFSIIVKPIKMKKHRSKKWRNGKKK